jgi:hypothetical protein
MEMYYNSIYELRLKVTIKQSKTTGSVSQKGTNKTSNKCKICYQTTQFMMIFNREKTHAQFQSQFGHKNAKLEQLSSLLSESRLQI